MKSAFKYITPNNGSIKNDILSGLTVALALVPEAIAFAFVAGISPVIGLYGAFIMGLVTAVFGGRPGMISGATGGAQWGNDGIAIPFCNISLNGFISNNSWYS